jgi:tetratricopeptide (TPR) repeat protein
MDLNEELIRQIKQKIATLEAEQILEAVRLTESFPPPGSDPADLPAQLLHDVALHAESLADWPLCIALYSRSLAYPVVSQSIPLGNWYRYALCQEHMGALREAVAGYRKALSYGEVWPHVSALARKRLADLLIAAEEYDEAAQLLAELSRSLPHPEIPGEQVEVDFARCLLRTGQPDAARQRLEAVCAGSIASEATIEGLRLLAQLCEESGQKQYAAACYQRIIESGAAGLEVKSAAAYRLTALLRSR